MKRKLGFLVLGLMVAILLFSTVPIVSSGDYSPMPDLTITSVTVVPGPVQNWHLVTAWVKNIGDHGADPGFNTLLFLDDGQSWLILKDYTHPIGIPRGWTVPVSKLFYLTNDPPERYKCVAVTDFYHELTEIREDNNVGESAYFWA
ncbi:MAG: hypothetical protein JSW06_10370 [Thermoplasmatales archaeon]|nr:MAG: hypothetical protein JSW06_10370 [Thermoplasmatales archaeon]